MYKIEGKSGDFCLFQENQSMFLNKNFVEEFTFPQENFLLRNMDDYTTTRLLEEHRDYLRLLEEHRDYLRLLEEHRDCSSNKVFVEEHRDCSSNKVFVEEHRDCSSNKVCTVCTVPQTKFVLFVLFLKQSVCCGTSILFLKENSCFHVTSNDFM